MNPLFGVCFVFLAAALLATTLAQDEVWLYVEQPRCCSDCTFVQGRFKCKLKSCLSKCPFPKKNGSSSQEPQPEEDEEEEERKLEEQQRNQEMAESIAGSTKHETEMPEDDNDTQISSK